MRRIFVPPRPRAKRYLKRASRSAPTCSIPVGLGAKRTRTDMAERVLAGLDDESCALAMKAGALRPLVVQSPGKDLVGEWYYIGHYGQLGPLTREQIDELVTGGVISRDTYVWRAGMP